MYTLLIYFCFICILIYIERKRHKNFGGAYVLLVSFLLVFIFIIVNMYLTHVYIFDYNVKCELVKIDDKWIKSSLIPNNSRNYLKSDNYIIYNYKENNTVTQQLCTNFNIIPDGENPYCEKSYSKAKYFNIKNWLLFDGDIRTFTGIKLDSTKLFISQKDLNNYDSFKVEKN